MKKFSYLLLIFIVLFLYGYSGASYTDDSSGDYNSSFKVDLIYVQGGEFMMGSDSSEAIDDEKPVHKVKVDSFYISKYEVSQKLYKKIMGENPSGYVGENKPVAPVTWFNAVKFCNKLSEKHELTPVYSINGKKVECNWDGDGYRLPTEAEWEYAARGGQKSNGYKYSGSNNIDEVAWYSENSEDGFHPVGMKEPNELGLYDMSGNVYEWCWDWWKFDYYSNSSFSNPKGPSMGSYRAARGGSWGFYASGVRIANRARFTPSGSVSYIGFRLVRNAE